VSAKAVRELSNVILGKLNLTGRWTRKLDASLSVPYATFTSRGFIRGFDKPQNTLKPSYFKALSH